MKITEIKTYMVANPPPRLGGPAWVFLKLVTDGGVEGLGEAYCVQLRPPTMVAIIEDIAERWVIGTDPFRIEALWRRIYSSGFSQHPDMVIQSVLSAVEMACWDIVGKEVGQPIYNLLGGLVNERLRSYTYLQHLPNQPKGNVHNDPDLAAESALKHADDGFTALKFDPVWPMMEDTPRQQSLEVLSNAEKVVKSVREAVGDRCDLLIGTHGQFTTSSAIRFAKRIEKYDPLWFEEPVPPENRDEMARVARSTSIPIASGERLSTKYEYRELLEKQAASILQFALGRCGGILEAKKIAGMAEAYYAQIAPHLYTGPVEGAANVQIGACCPNFLIQESIGKWDGFHAEILKRPLKWEDGYIIPPTEPGLGIELDGEVAAQNVYVEGESAWWPN